MPNVRVVRRPNPKATRWIFSVNNHGDLDIELLNTIWEQLKHPLRYLCYGRDETEIKGYLEFKKGTQVYLSQMKSLFGDAAERTAFQQAKGSKQQLVRQCSAIGTLQEMKEQTERITLEEMAEELKVNGEGDTSRKYGDEFWSNYSAIKNTASRMKNIEAEEIIREKMKSMELRPWQKWVVSMMEFQGDRRVLFVVDEAGGLGKTWLTKWYHVNLEAAVYTTTKRGDVAYAYNGESGVIFDLSRSQLEKINFDTIESLKNGMIFSTKYESRLKLYQPPRVVVFMNKRPELYKNLSTDRLEMLWFKKEDGGEKTMVTRAWNERCHQPEDSLKFVPLEKMEDLMSQRVKKKFYDFFNNQDDEVGSIVEARKSQEPELLHDSQCLCEDCVFENRFAQNKETSIVQLSEKSISL